MRSGKEAAAYSLVPSVEFQEHRKSVELAAEPEEVGERF
jgi:hypothetical protein